jgi:hypothetical protein
MKNSQQQSSEETFNEKMKKKFDQLDWSQIHRGKDKQPQIDLSHYPDTCPHCGKPAFIGLTKVDCSSC